MGPDSYRIRRNNAKRTLRRSRSNLRSPILVPIESYVFLLVNNTNLPPILHRLLAEISPIIGQIFASDKGSLHFNALAGGDLLRISR